MRGTVTVLDSSNLDAVIADATGEPIEKKADEKKDEAQQAPIKAETEEAEDENGLTSADKKSLTEKMQKAIGKKHRALREAEDFATDQYSGRRLAEQRAEQMEREVNRLKAQTPAPVQVAVEPKREDFKTDQDFSNALVDWKVDQKFKIKAQEESERREQDRIEEIKKAAGERITKALGLVPDFGEVVNDADIEVPGHIAGYMQESDMIAELGYHFAKNPEVLEDLRKMSPAKALVAIGKIESKLETFGTKKPETSNGATPSSKVTALEPSKETQPRVAAPIVPLNGNSGGQVEKPFSEMNYQEAKASWLKEKGIRLDRRQRH